MGVKCSSGVMSGYVKSIVFFLVIMIPYMNTMIVSTTYVIIGFSQGDQIEWVKGSTHCCCCCCRCVYAICVCECYYTCLHAGADP